MAIKKSVEKDKRRIRAVISGDFTIEDLVQAIDESISDPDFEPGFDVLSDHKQIGTPITASQVKHMTFHLQTLRAHMGGARWAVVASKPDSFQMMRLLSVLAERIPMYVRVFDSLEEAEAWLATPKAD